MFFANNLQKIIEWYVMTYKFTAIKSSESNDEEFESAFHCSAQSVQSILHDYDIVVTVQHPSIYVSLSDYSTEKSLPFSLSECGSLINGAFMDAGGYIYPQYLLIEKISL